VAAVLGKAKVLNIGADQQHQVTDFRQANSMQDRTNAIAISWLRFAIIDLRRYGIAHRTYHRPEHAKLMLGGRAPDSVSRRVAIIAYRDHIREIGLHLFQAKALALVIDPERPKIATNTLAIQNSRRLVISFL
jgi:hypothetical protein